jgi:hypothetical protein
MTCSVSATARDGTYWVYQAHSEIQFYAPAIATLPDERRNLGDAGRPLGFGARPPSRQLTFRAQHPQLSGDVRPEPCAR